MTGLRKPADASLYSLDVDGTLKKKVDVVDLSNGIAWTADNTTMFYVDTVPKRHIYAFDYDINTGNIGK